MKPATAISMLIIFVVLSVRANEPSSTEINQKLFFICRGNKAECKITVRSGDDMPQGWQEEELRLAQLLQRYINKLSGVVIPVEAYTYPDPNRSEDMTNAIELDTSPFPIYTGYCTVSFRRDKQGKLVGPPISSRVSLVIGAHDSNQYCARAAVSNFVEAAFGPPLSAIDDLNYQWPHKPTLVIDLDKFETIKYPPETHETPRYLSPPEQK